MAFKSLVLIRIADIFDHLRGVVPRPMLIFTHFFLKHPIPSVVIVFSLPFDR